MSINPISSPGYYNTFNNLPPEVQDELETKSSSTAISQMNADHEHRKEETDEINQQANS
jgi:hypothetical protein